MRQTNRRQCPKCITDVHLGVPQDSDPKVHWPLRFTCHSGQRKRGAGAWDFRGEVDNLQVDGKEHMCGKQILAGPPRNSGTRESENRFLLRSFLSVTLHSDRLR